MNKISNGETKKPLHCTFCGKSQHEVRKLIAGPTVFICDECVELCMDIIGEENKSSLAKSGDKIPTPKEIRKVLDDYVIGHNAMSVRAAPSPTALSPRAEHPRRVRENRGAGHPSVSFYARRYAQQRSRSRGWSDPLLHDV